MLDNHLATWTFSRELLPVLETKIPRNLKHGGAHESSSEYSYLPQCLPSSSPCQSVLEIVKKKKTALIKGDFYLKPSGAGRGLDTGDRASVCRWAELVSVHVAG